MSSKKRHDGELTIDHRGAEGALPAAVANPVGLEEVRAGQIYQCATVTCWHCGGVYVVNKLRTRPREYCRTCDAYICDFCHNARSEPGYVHRSFEELCNLVQSGKYTLSGSASRAILIPVIQET